MRSSSKKVLFVAVVLAAAAILAVVVVARRPADTPEQRRARRLLRELRGRGEIAYFLERIGLIKSRALRDPSQVVRDLAALGPRGVPCLIEAMDDDSEYTATLVADQLGRMGPDQAADAVPALIAVADDTSRYEQTRIIAARALAKLGETKKSFGVLGAMLRSSDGWVRHDAATVLRDLGPAAEPAIPALIEALEDPARHVREKANEALARIGSPAVPALIKAIEHKDWVVREQVAWALGQIGPEAAAAVPLLKQATKDEEQKVRMGAAKALKKIQAEDRGGHSGP